MKILKSKETQRPQVEPESWTPVIITTDTMGRKMTDADFVSRFATPEELASLRAAIERRKAGEPKFDYFVCDKCGWKSKMRHGTFEPSQKVRCPACNAQGYRDGGWLRPMTAKEAKEFEKAAAENFKKGVERSRRQAFAAKNESRARQGLSLLKYDEWLKDRTKGRA